jgi:putative addiction module CopG family antidote
MEIHLTPDQEAFVREAVAEGRLRSAEDAVAQALAMWEERERRRVEILAALDDAEADIARGDYVEITEDSMKNLAQEIKQRGRALLSGTPIAAGK